jgi:Rrf2 family protein
VLSQKTRYALKALLELAAQPEGTTLSSAVISARRSIPVKFLETILMQLKREGVVRGQRGRGGGYQLALSAAAISFGGVVRLMQGPLGLLPCVSVTQYRRCADCADNDACELKKLFRAVRDSTSAILDGWTLADALGRPNAYAGFATGMKSRRRPTAKKSATGRRAPKLRRRRARS